MNKLCNGYIIHRLLAAWLVAGQSSLCKVNDKARDLGGQHAKIVGDDNKKDAYTQPELILPEIFV